MLYSICNETNLENLKIKGDNNAGVDTFIVSTHFIITLVAANCNNYNFLVFHLHVMIIIYHSSHVRL